MGQISSYYWKDEHIVIIQEQLTRQLRDNAPNVAPTCQITDDFINRQIAEQLAELHCKMRQGIPKSSY